jgi:hypothetical protein
VLIPYKTAGFGLAVAESGSFGASGVFTDKKGILMLSVSVPLRAGEEIRTPDVQLGKLAFYH